MLMQMIYLKKKIKIINDIFNLNEKLKRRIY
jgi:hypothetical protein